MKIITFQKNHPLPEVMQHLTKKIGNPQAFATCHQYRHASCMCVTQELFSKHKEHFMYFKPKVEENAKIRLHAEKMDEIPWGIAYMGGPKLWKKSQGKGVKVAVIDTGISRNHRDLRGQIKGGINLVQGGSNGHGTHVAGIIAAARNHWGIVGMGPEIELYDVRAFGADGTASLANIMRGIDWCIENRMHVVNMSFGMPEYSEGLAQLTKKAASQGIVMVASAGNNGGAVEYPARYPHVIGVGALDRNGRLASFSSRGAGMSASAPGVDILSTWPNNSFKKLNGTSMAAPHIAGREALRKAAKLRAR